MRVALVIHAYDAARGGVERYTDTLARALLDSGHAVHVIASRADALPEGAALHAVRAPSFWSPVRTWAFAAGVARLLDRQRGAWDAVLGLARTPRQDVYRVGGGSHRAYLRATSSRAGRGLARLSPRHGSLLAMERRIFDGWRTGATRRYLCNASRARDEIVADYGVRPERIDVLYNPVDPARFDPGRWSAGRAAGRSTGSAPAPRSARARSGSSATRSATCTR